MVDPVRQVLKHPQFKNEYEFAELPPSSFCMCCVDCRFQQCTMLVHMVRHRYVEHHESNNLMRILIGILGTIFGPHIWVVSSAKHMERFYDYELTKQFAIDSERDKRTDRNGSKKTKWSRHSIWCHKNQNWATEAHSHDKIHCSSGDCWHRSSFSLALFSLARCTITFIFFIK